MIYRCTYYTADGTKGQRLTDNPDLFLAKCKVHGWTHVSTERAC
jgi:hypothetical protein